MTLTPEERQLINNIINVTELYNNMTHEQQLDRLKAITEGEKYHIIKIQEILGIKYNTVQSYFKTSKRSTAGNWMGNKMPLEYICKLCFYYNRSLDWFLKNV